MTEINSLHLIDGNQYLVNSSNSVSESSSNQSISFDKVLNSQTKTLEDIFQSVSKEYGVSIKLLKAVAQAESGFDTNAVSGCGASGIMQLMPTTAQSLGVEDVFDAEQNITGGAKMLAYLLDDYGGNTTLALAAYNAGSGNVAKYGGVPPFAETQNYIKKINHILGGELEADTTSISIAKNANNSVSNSSTNTSTNATTSFNVKSVINPVVTKDNEDQAMDAFTYETYLKFLEMYEELSSSVLDSSKNKTDEDKEQDKEQDKEKELQNHFKLQQARFNSRAISLLEIN